MVYSYIKNCLLAIMTNRQCPHDKFVDDAFFKYNKMCRNMKSQSLNLISPYHKTNLNFN